MGFVKCASGLAALAMLGASLLPWLDVGATDVTALPSPAFATSVEAPAMLALWAVPIQAVLVLVLGALGRPSRLLAFGCGTTPLVALAVISLFVRNGLYPVLGIGWYAAAAAGLVMALDAAGLLGRPAPGAPGRDPA